MIIKYIDYAEGRMNEPVKRLRQVETDSLEYLGNFVKMTFDDVILLVPTGRVIKVTEAK